MKKVVAVTGIRSEYDILYPVIKELRKREFDVSVLVSGAHLSDKHGMTQNKIIEDGFRVVDRVDTLLSTDRIVQRPKGVALLIHGMSQAVEREKPDFLIVVGDREESIATAIVGNYMGCLVVHLAGGDPTFGNADDPMRFAVSKLSHIHCTFANEYANNLKTIGEEGFRIFWTGNPSYANIEDVPFLSKKQLFNKLEKKIEKYNLLIQHPLSSELDSPYQQMIETLEALKQFNLKHDYKTICILPNTDPGSFELNRAINEYRDNNSMFFFDTLDRKLFINIVRHASALVGNSSMGILEAPYYKLPVINVGNRQKGRLNAGNVRFVDHDKNSIVKELELACLDEEYKAHVEALSNPYGDSTSAIKVCNVIENIDTKDKQWHIKRKLC
mgnify:FL=1